MNEIIVCMFSDHNTMILEVNHKKKFGKTTNTWRSNNMLLKNEWVTQKIKEEIKNRRRQMQLKTQQSKTLGVQQRQS